MLSKRGSMLAVALVAMFTVAAFVPMAEASHKARIVWPYGVDERHIPVIAGYKIVPDPLQCNHGTAAGTPIYQNDFSSGLGSVVVQTMDVGPRHVTRNLWHSTSFVGKGTDFGHSAGGRLYFGNDATGIFGTSGFLIQGLATVQVAVPAGALPYYLAFNTKWETEWLEGYDHMWVEAVPADGKVYILCTLNPEGRGDPSSNPQSLGSCSPYSDVAIPCPVSARRFQNMGIPTQAIDAAAPHWEARFVQIPPIWNGQTVTLRLTFDSADGVSNNFLGWMVDDLAVTDTVVPAPNALPVVTGLVGSV